MGATQRIYAQTQGACWDTADSEQPWVNLTDLKSLLHYSSATKAGCSHLACRQCDHATGTLKCSSVTCMGLGAGT